MKKYTRFLTMALVMSMIAVLPASAQVVSGAAGESNLSLLIPINRLELTEDQMVELHDILSNVLANRNDMDSAVAALEQSMIEFSGTGEELDELLVNFREAQIEQAEAMREVFATSLDSIGDLLSINQGMVLREELPGLLLGRGQEMVAGNRGEEAMSLGVGQRMPMGAMGRTGMMIVQVGSRLPDVADRFSEDSCSSSVHQFSGENSYWHEMPSSAMSIRSGRAGMMREMQVHRMPDLTSSTMENRTGRESMLRMMQQDSRSDLTSRMMQSSSERELMLRSLQDGSTNDLPEMIQQRLEQGSQGEEFSVMREQIRARLEQFGEQVPDELRERLGGAMSGLAERVGQRMSGRGMMTEDEPRMMMSRQSSSETQQADHGNLFELLEQIVEVLELKLEALE